jgi:hypothetical protein
MTNGSKAELKHNFNRFENTFSEELKAQMAIVIKAHSRLTYPSSELAYDFPEYMHISHILMMGTNLL